MNSEGSQKALSALKGRMREICTSGSMRDVGNGTTVETEEPAPRRNESPGNSDSLDLQPPRPPSTLPYQIYFKETPMSKVPRKPAAQTRA